MCARRSPTNFASRQVPTAAGRDMLYRRHPNSQSSLATVTITRSRLTKKIVMQIDNDYSLSGSANVRYPPNQLGIDNC